MANYTDNLNLKKWDLNSSTDLSSKFDIDGTLNDNWDKVDEAVGANSTNIATNTANIATNATNIATNASNIETLQNNATDISVLEEQVETNTTNIATIEAKNTEQDENITALEEKAETHEEEIEELIEEEELVREDINAISSTYEADGEVIHVEDASNARLTNIEIYGNTDDDGNSVEDSVDLVISNKNLLDTSNWEDQTLTDDEENEFTITKNSDGTFTFNGTYTNSSKHVQTYFPVVIPARIAKNCKMSMNIISGTATEDGIRFYLWDTENGSVWMDESNPTYYATFQEIDYTKMSIYIGKNTVCENAVISFQVEYGTSATDYVEHESQYYSLPVQSAMTVEDYFDFNNEQEVHVNGDTLDFTDEQKAVAKKIVNLAHSYSTITNVYTINTVGANLKFNYIDSTTLGERVTELEEEVERLRSDIESMAITEETEGETIYLTDASNARLTNIEIYGNTDDDGNSVEESITLVISNKNLLDTSNWEDQILTDDEENEFTITKNSDGTFTFNGTYANSATHVNIYFPVVIPARIAKNCKMSMNIISGTAAEDGIRFYLWDTDGGSVWMDESNPTYYATFQEIDYTKMSIYIGKDTVCENAVISFQVEYGTSATDYVEHESQYYSLPVQSAMTSEDYFDFDNEQEVHTSGSLDMTSEQKAVAKEIANTIKTYSDVTNIYTTNTVGANIKVTYCKDIPTIISNIQSTLETLTADDTTEE